jgi:hypothetical protein
MPADQIEQQIERSLEIGQPYLKTLLVVTHLT